MDIEYKGANCVVITTKKTTVIIDPRLSHVGLKDLVPKNAVVLATQPDLMSTGGGEDAVVVDRPGEYEIRDISIVGIAAERMIDHDKSLAATMYRLIVGDVRFAVIGHVAVPLSDEQIEALGIVDVVIVPVGGNGYTLDARQAVNLVQRIDPKVVIPTHFAAKGLTYEVPQMELEPFVKELGAPQADVTAKWKLKTLPEVLTVVAIDRTA